MRNREIQYVIEQVTGVITLNRPETKNAITTDMWEGLPSVLETVRDAGARVIVLTGTGDAFASGADLLELNELRNYGQAEKFWTAIENCLKTIWRFDLPVIAMVNGACVGGGCLLATACDLRYAAKSATFAIPVSKLGIVLDDESVARLVSIIGDANARYMLLTALSLDSEEAERCGLINKSFEDSALNLEVMRIAAAIGRNDSTSVAATKRSLQRIRDGRPCNSEEERKLIVQSYLNPELRERVENLLQTLQSHQQTQS